MTTRRASTAAVFLSLASPLAVMVAGPAGAQVPPSTTPTTPVPPPTPPMPTRHQVDIKATIRATRQGSVFVGRGTFTGKPFAKGTFGTRTRVIGTGPLRVRAQITLTTRTGRVIINATASGSGSILRGRASVSRGTGAYKGITGSNLSVSFTNGGTTKARLKGVVKFADKA